MRIRVGRTRYMADEGPVSAWTRLSSCCEWRVFKPTVQRWPFFGPFWGFLPSRRSGDLLVVAGSTPEAKPRSPVLQNPLRVYLYRELISNLAIQGDRSMATGHCVWRYPKMPTFVGLHALCPPFVQSSYCTPYSVEKIEKFPLLHLSCFSASKWIRLIKSLISSSAPTYTWIEKHIHRGW